MVEWIMQKAIGAIYKQVFLAPVRVGTLFRKQIEYKKLHVSDLTRKANFIIIGIIGGAILLAAVLFFLLGAVLTLVFMGLIIVLVVLGYLNVEVDYKLKQAQELRAQQYNMGQIAPVEAKSGGQMQKVIALSVIVVGLILCVVGAIVFSTSDPVQVPHSWFQGWGVYEWLFRGIIPLLLLGSMYVLIVHKSSDLLKFTAGFIVVLIVVIGIGKGVGAVWTWAGSLFSGSSASSSNTPGPGFAKYSANSNSARPSAAAPTQPSKGKPVPQSITDAIKEGVVTAQMPPEQLWQELEQNKANYPIQVTCKAADKCFAKVVPNTNGTRWQARANMSVQGFQEYNSKYTALGYRLASHQFYVDGGGVEFHQAVWLKDK